MLRASSDRRPLLGIVNEAFVAPGLDALRGEIQWLGVFAHDVL